MNVKAILSSAALALFGIGCAAEGQSSAPESTSSQSEQLTWYFYSAPWVWDLYGLTLNGRSLSGADLTGHGVLGVSTSDVQWRGHDLSVSLDKTEFRAAHGASGASIVGAVFTANLDDGSTVPVRIDAIRKDHTESSEDVLLYDVSYQTKATWEPYCGIDDKGNAIAAIPLTGRWDYRQGAASGGAHIVDDGAFTFACRGHALAQCVELGYEPWRTAKVCQDRKSDCTTVSLANTHQACTRAIRADYCGNGTSYTKDGTLIDIYDPFGIRIAEPGWPFEAEWTAGGARCAARLREPAAGTPTCWSQLQDPSCGDATHFETGTLLMTQDSP